MGYTTEFRNFFTLDKPLTSDQRQYLNLFSETRRMGRKVYTLHQMKKHCTGNTEMFLLLDKLKMDVGENGEFYGGEDCLGEEEDSSVVDYNTPPKSQPGLWCQWVPSACGLFIEWNGSEKFSHYVKWLEYIINKFLIPWGHNLNGKVSWEGERSGDIGIIQVVNNKVTTHNDLSWKEIEEIMKDPNATLDKVETTELISEPTFEGKLAPSTDDVVLDLINLRNELSTAKKGTAVATKKLDTLIKKYTV